MILNCIGNGFDLSKIYTIPGCETNLAQNTVPVGLRIVAPHVRRGNFAWQTTFLTIIHFNDDAVFACFQIFRQFVKLRCRNKLVFSGRNAINPHFCGTCAFHFQTYQFSLPAFGNRNFACIPCFAVMRISPLQMMRGISRFAFLTFLRLS